MITVTIDPNVRVKGNQTFASWPRDVDNGGDDHWLVSLHHGNQTCKVIERESGIHCLATVTEVNWEKHLLFIRVPWNELFKSNPYTHECRCGEPIRKFDDLWVDATFDDNDILSDLTVCASFAALCENGGTHAPGVTETP